VGWYDKGWYISLMKFFCGNILPSFHFVLFFYTPMWI